MASKSICNTVQSSLHNKCLITVKPCVNLCTISCWTYSFWVESAHLSDKVLPLGKPVNLNLSR